MAQVWKQMAKVAFWKEVKGQTVLDTNGESIEEIFARNKIVPNFMEFNDFFTWAIKSEKERRPHFNPIPGVEFLDTITEKLNAVDKTSANINQAYDNEQAIQDKIINKQREVLASEFLKLDERIIEYMFPRFAAFKVQDIFMQLQDKKREKWGERTYDNTLYSAIFQRYFKDDFNHLADQKVNKYLPYCVKSDIKPDLMLISRAKDVPFVICEYSESNSASNCKDLIKLVETMQMVLTKRIKSFHECSKAIYGILCGGDKLTLLCMQYNYEGYYDCFFIAANKRELQTLQLDFENFATILKMNIILKLNGLNQFQFAPKPSKLSDCKDVLLA